MTATLTKVLTIPQVAKLAGWTRNRMWVHLSKVNEELGGTLLRNVSRGTERPRWTVTLGALQMIAPQWFQDPESLQKQLDELDSQNRELYARVVKIERVQTLHTEWLSDIAAKSA